MYGKEMNNPMQKNHNVKLGKSGFTLVELCVVMVLVAILSTMIVSFSVLMNGYAVDNEEEYDFLNEYATLKEEFKKWVSENDVKGNVFNVSETNETITVTMNETVKTVSFSEGILIFGENQRINFDTIDDVKFYLSENLIKCVVYRVTKDAKLIEHSFVLSLRCVE